MSTIATISVGLTADISNFTAGMKKSADSITTFKNAAQVISATRTPAEALTQSTRSLGAMLAKGTIDAQQHARAIALVADQYRQAQAAAQSATALGKFRGAAASALGIGSGIGVTITAINATKEALSSLAHGIADTTISSIKMAAGFENAEQSFKTLYKSASDATEVIGELKAFAAETPFEFQELQQAAVKLAGFGVASKQLLPTLEMLGDLTLKDTNTIGQLAETYGKARIQGRAYTRDINEFTTAGVPAWEALAASQRKSVDEIKAMVEAGEIGFPQLQMALESLRKEGGRFAGNLKDQSQTLTGLASTLKDNVNLALADFGKILVEELHIKETTQRLIELTNGFSGVAGEARAGIGAMKDLADSFAEVDAMMMGPLQKTKNEIGLIVALRQKVLDLQHAYATMTGNTDLAAAIEGMREEREHPRPKAPRKPRELEIEKGGRNAEMEELAKVREGIAKTTDELRKQLFILEHGTAEWEHQQRAIAGLTAAERVAFAVLEDEVDEMRIAADAAKKLDDATLDLRNSLRDQIDAFYLSADAIALYKLAELGASEATLKSIKAQQEHIATLKKRAEAEKAAQSQAKHWVDFGKSEQEKLAEQIQDIRNLQFDEALTAAQADAAIAKLTADKSHKQSDRGYTSTPAAEFGSAEAWHTIARAMNGTGDNIPAQQLDVQRQMLAALKDVNANRESRRQAYETDAAAKRSAFEGTRIKEAARERPMPKFEPFTNTAEALVAREKGRREAAERREGRGPAEDIAAKRRMREGDQASRMAEIDRKQFDNAKVAAERQQRMFAEIDAKRKAAEERRAEMIASIDAQHRESELARNPQETQRLAEPKPRSRSGDGIAPVIKLGRDKDKAVPVLERIEALTRQQVAETKNKKVLKL